MPRITLTSTRTSESYRPATQRKLIYSASVLLIVVSLAAHTVGARAENYTAPSSAFVQLGSVSKTQTLTGGVTWDLPFSWSFGSAELTSYLEASYSYWQVKSEGRAGLSHLSQLAVVPVIRYRPGAGLSPWFFEGGVGVSATSSIYRNREKSFSTSFNFGTHLGLGRSFGERRQHEVSLRVEHFSNAGIKHPNPGENFLQIRYARRF